jgi:hypothetical protein
MIKKPPIWGVGGLKIWGVERRKVFFPDTAENPFFRGFLLFYLSIRNSIFKPLLVYSIKEENLIEIDY